MLARILTAFSLIGLAAAIRVLAPTASSQWASGTAQQTVSWEYVQSDATSFIIQLINQDGYLPNSIPITLAQGVMTSSQSTVVTPPSGSWPVGQRFRINLVDSTDTNQRIYAQSDYFNIGNTGAAVATAPTTVAGLTSQRMTTTAPAAVVYTTGYATAALAGDASGGIPNAVATSKAAGEFTAVPSALTSILIAVAAFFGLLA